MYLYWCNECDWEERMDKHKYDFCPKCDHVNISRSGTSNIHDMVKELNLDGEAFGKTLMDIHREDS